MDGPADIPADPALELQPATSLRRPEPDPWAHRRGEPRTFAAAWIVFLFLLALTIMGSLGLAGLVSVEVYRTASRVLLAGVGAGIGIAWPMLRLSQEAPQRPLAAMAQDILVVALPAQAVLWPQALPWMAGFPPATLIAVSLSFLAWTLLLSGILALMLLELRRRPHLPRWAMMAGIVLLVLGGPCSTALAPPKLPADSRPESVDPALLTSPITAPLEALRDRGWSGRPARALPEHFVAPAVITLASLPPWAAAFVRRRRIA